MTNLDLAAAFKRRQTHVLARKLGGLADLDRNEVALLDEIAAGGVDLPADMLLYAEGDAQPTPGVLLAGWAYTLRQTSDGRRQILRFVLPGDCFGLPTGGQSTAIDTLVTATRCTVADARRLVPGETHLRQPHDGIDRACALAAALDQSYILNQIVRLGLQTAHERLANLIMEFDARLHAVGLADDAGFNLPLSQETLSNALGISLVHVNRNLQKLRHENIITLSQHTLRILNRDMLAELADMRGHNSHQRPHFSDGPAAEVQSPAASVHPFHRMIARSRA